MSVNQMDKGQKLYALWCDSGTLPPAILRPWVKLAEHEQSRWVWLAKKVGTLSHRHQIPPPADPYLFTTQDQRRVDVWDYDTVTHSSLRRPPDPTEDWCYDLWAQLQLSHIRTHWWQRHRPLTVDTSRRTFEEQLAERKGSYKAVGSL
jgi:hypothetical protein